MSIFPMNPLSGANCRNIWRICYQNILNGFWACNFDLVKTPTRKSFTCGRMLLWNERMAWGVLKATLNVDEPIRSNGNLELSWDNHIKWMDWCLARLDCAYLAIAHDMEIDFKANEISHTWGKCEIKSPSISMEIEMCKPLLRKFYWKVNKFGSLIG